MADDSKANVPSPESLEPFLTHNDENNAKKNDSSPAKKADDAKDDAKGNDVE